MRIKQIALLVAVVIVGVAVYFAAHKNNPVTENTSPDTANTTSDEGKVESTSFTVKSEGKTETLTFHDVSGFTIRTFADEEKTDRIVVSEGDNDILQIGVNWFGNTLGLPLQQVVLIKNSYIGNLYRATGGGIADGGYVLAATTKTSGTCEGDVEPALAPCSTTDQVYGKDKVMTYLPFCLSLDSVEKCDLLMSRLEIKQ